MSKRAGSSSGSLPSGSARQPEAGRSVELLTLRQVAERLQVCVRTVRRLIAQQGVPVVMVGRQIRVPAQHVALLITKMW